MLTHSVFFWLKDDVSERDRELFRKDAEALAVIESAVQLFVGEPVSSYRPVVDSSFTFALTVLFADQAALDAYQVAEMHTAFIEKHTDKWERVLVYDAE